MTSTKGTTKVSTKKIVLATIASGLLFYIFVGPLFQLGFFTGIGFVISCARAAWKRVVFKSPKITIYIAIAYVITNIAFRIFFPWALADLLKGSVVAALMVAGVYLYTYLKARQLRTY